VQVDLDHDVPVPQLPERRHLPGAVRDREDLDTLRILRRDGVRHPDEEGEVGGNLLDTLPDGGAVCAVLVQRPRSCMPARIRAASSRTFGRPRDSRFARYVIAASGQASWRPRSSSANI
jgi:hypothetical protein